jgi:hypothetical protein
MAMARVASRIAAGLGSAPALCQQQAFVSAGYCSGAARPCSNPYGLAAGREEGGEVRFSQPEIAVYEAGLPGAGGPADWPAMGMGYPDLLEGAGGAIFMTQTNKTHARLHELSGRFRGMQKAYLGHMTKLRSSSSMSALIGSSGAGGGGGGEGERDTGFTDEQMHELANAEEDVDERMREIQRIAKSVEELAVMFKELAVLIVEQGTILDRIDHNMEQAVERTEEGVKELVQADKHQKSARPICCMAVLMALIIICVISEEARLGAGASCARASAPDPTSAPHTAAPLPTPPPCSYYRQGKPLMLREGGCLKSKTGAFPLCAHDRAEEGGRIPGEPFKVYWV